MPTPRQKRSNPPKDKHGKPSVAELQEQVSALTRDLTEARQQQTATADVLKIVSCSAFDLQTLLDMVIESAGQLCRADQAGIRLEKDGLYYHIASYGFEAEHIERMRREPLKPNNSIIGRALLEGKPIHIVDAQSDRDHALAQRAKSGNVHTLLGVPMLRDGAPIGMLILTRHKVQLFQKAD